MKKNTVTIISTIILFIPWTILILRMNTWALVSPIAEIIIIIYAVIMIISGLFTAILTLSQVFRVTNVEF
jgi:hypothetical protein